MKKPIAGHTFTVFFMRALTAFYRLPIPNGSRTPGQEGALGSRPVLRQHLPSGILVSLHLERVRYAQRELT